MAVEPDVVQGWDYKDGAGERGMAASAAPVCIFDDQESGGGVATLPGVVAWNADAAFSQFAAARAKVGAKQGKITIAHLDTGFDPAHRTLPAGLVAALQRNFVDGGAGPNDATDRAPAGSLTSNRGHGTGTLSLLAGNKLAGNSPGWPGFTDFVGGAPQAKIIPVRIADWVVRFSTSTMVQGFDYARAKGAHVLSMSMGGLSSSALVDAINLAYDNGVVMVTAARQQFCLSAIAEEHRLSGPLPARDRGLRRDGGWPRLCRPELPDHAGQLRAGEQDEDGARRLYAERAVGGDRLPQHRRHGRLGHVGRDAADRRGGSTLAGRALGYGEELFAAVDAHRGGAGRRCFPRRRSRPPG